MEHLRLRLGAEPAEERPELDCQIDKYQVCRDLDETSMERVRQEAKTRRKNDAASPRISSAYAVQQ